MSIDLTYTTAPLVDASDLPVRLLWARHGATCLYTQMIDAERFLVDLKYQEFHLNDLQTWSALQVQQPLVCQLGGCRIEDMCKAARLVECHAQGIDVNMGCPQDPITSRGFGASLIRPGQWSEAISIIASLKHQTPLPVSAKIRLCTPASSTPKLGLLLEEAGTDHITLHARYPNAIRRRKGAALLEEVAALKQAVSIPVVSNGNVRTWQDVQLNQASTCADGVMSGVGLLRNPYLFEGIVRAPQEAAQEYLSICREVPGTYAFSSAKKHLEYFYQREDLAKEIGSRMQVRLKACRSLDELQEAVCFG